VRFARALEVSRDGEDKQNAARALWGLGKVDMANGDPGAARIKLDAALRAFQSFEMKRAVIECLEDHADLAQSFGRAGDAVRLYAAVEALRERHALPRPPRYAERWTQAIAAARSVLGDVAFYEAWTAGKAWELEQATRHALEHAAVHPVTA
jgi:hypothetical protein